MVKIAFNLKNIDVRGTATAGYDYAVSLKEYYNIDSILLASNNETHDEIAILKFKKRFQLFYYDNYDDINKIVKDNLCDILYTIKYGKNDGVNKCCIPEVIHCVFDMSEPHGSLYVGVSKYVANKYGYNLYVPHMISLKPSKTNDNMRKMLNIPNDAIIFGRHGGIDTFNINFVMDNIIKIVNEYKNIYFVFVNTLNFYTHNQIIYLDKIIDNDIKNKYISTLDAYIEAGSLGHSFGIACGEVSINNKPIILYDSPNLWNKAHIDIIGDKGIYFTDSDSFYKAITEFNPKNYINKDLNAYKYYNPKNIIKIFKETFIDSILDTKHFKMYL